MQTSIRVAAVAAVLAMSLTIAACSGSDTQYAGSSTQSSLSDGTPSGTAWAPYLSSGITPPGTSSQGY